MELRKAALGFRYLAVLYCLCGTVMAQSPETERMYASDTREAQRLYDDARVLSDSGDLPKSLELLNKALYLRPNYTEAYYQRARIKEQLDLPLEALVDYEILLQLDSAYLEAAFDRAKLRFKQQQYTQALKEFYQVLNMPVSETRMVYFKSMPLNETGNAPVNAITTGYHLEPEVQNYLGLCYHELQLYDSAISAFTQAINLKGSEPNYYVNRGLSRAAIKATNLALADFKSALLLDPNHAVAEFNLTQELENTHGLDVSVYDQIIANNPEFASPYVNRASAKMDLQDYKGAIGDYTTALSLEPDNAQIRANRALAWEKSENLKSALRDYNRAIALDPNMVMAYRGRGRVLASLAQPELALEDFNTALKLAPNDGGTFFNRALVYRGLGNMSQCCNDLQQAELLGLEVATRALKAYCQAE